jgi:acyl-CoA hydrolase
LAEVNHGLPVAAREAALPAEAVTVISDVERPALTIPIASPSPAAEQIGRQVASLIPPGATVQYGPGIIGDAVIRALQVPVRVQSGVVSDAVMDLDRRGLLLGSPLTAYVIGTPELFEWADGRPMADRVERTHDITSLSQQAFFAINTALEIDWSGQVNVEGFRGDTVAGVGGHPDFAAAAAIAKRGASIVAVSRTRGRHRTLVEHLSAPASTARSDVDIVVTERGIADLRGLDDTERRRLLLHTWGDADDEVGRNS